MLERMRSKGKTPPLLVGVQTLIATVEISVTASLGKWELIQLFHS